MPWTRTGLKASMLDVGQLRELTLGSATVLLVRSAFGLFATAARCSHEAGALMDGVLVENRLSCPDHGATFDISDGRVLIDPFGVEPPPGGAGTLPVFETKVEDDEVWVNLD